MMATLLVITTASIIFWVLMATQRKKEAIANKNFELTLKMIEARNKKHLSKTK